MANTLTRLGGNATGAAHSHCAPHSVPSCRAHSRFSLTSCQTKPDSRLSSHPVTGIIPDEPRGVGKYLPSAPLPSAPCTPALCPLHPCPLHPAPRPLPSAPLPSALCTLHPCPLHLCSLPLFLDPSMGLRGRRKSGYRGGKALVRIGRHSKLKWPTTTHSCASARPVVHWRGPS